ncbi:MAG: bifunctional 5,10-methylenetetrahydrofolate dehydrogenase/5,10-methenyltetrahydrofolate cyclohydrolase [Candidatus Cloacimonadia bacterium]
MVKDLIAKPISEKIYKQIVTCIEENQAVLKLKMMIVGEDPASTFYVNNIKNNCRKLGIEVDTETLPVDVSQDELLNHINEANQDPSVTGIMVQKPLPKHICSNSVAAAIDPYKDVDGFNPKNLGELMIEIKSLRPSTAQAVREFIRYYEIELAGKHTVLCGRSNIVGKPLASMLIGKREPGNATLTVCHSKTGDISRFTKQADILITALGQPRFITADMIKEGVIIIDVGTNEVEENGKRKYVGDVDFEGCYEKAKAITPVPGGVGSVTTATLLRNIMKAYKMQNGLFDEI